MRSQEIDYQTIKDESEKWGATLFGVAEFSPNHIKTCALDQKLLDELPFGIAIGLRLADAVFEDLDDHPTLLYLHHYRQANYVLDRIAFHVAALIQRLGGRALPIAASHIVDWDNQRGHVSHKGLARAAGLGWLGRNNLIVHPDFGARIRLVSILTDLPLKTNQPLDDSCGECHQCIAVCPAGAIRQDVAHFDHLACFEKLKEFRQKHNVGQYICGVCIKACGPHR